MKTHFQFSYVPTDQINTGNKLTDFSMGSDPPFLQGSLREIGMTHPVSLTPQGNSYHIVCGHRRVRAAMVLGLENLPANLLPPSMTDEAKLAFNLRENSRNYSDPEKAAILRKLLRVEIAENKIIEQYMPILGLERSKKLLRDLLKTGQLRDSFQRLLHELNIPIRVYAPLFRWDHDSQKEAERIFAALRPGVNKLRELVDLLDETSHRDGTRPGDILNREELRTTWQHAEPQYDKVHKILYHWRFPTLASLKKSVWRAMDQLDLHPNTKIRTMENFENGEMKIELAFKTGTELTTQVEQLSKASQSQSMANLLQVFKNLKP